MKQIEQSNSISFYIVWIMLTHFETKCYTTEVLRSEVLQRYLDQLMD